VIYANGVSATKGAIIKPGCQIVVPEKPKKPFVNTTSRILAFASVLASLSVTMVAIFRK